MLPVGGQPAGGVTIARYLADKPEFSLAGAFENNPKASSDDVLCDRRFFWSGDENLL